MCIELAESVDFNKTIMRLSFSGGKKSKMRSGDIVGAVCSIGKTFFAKTLDRIIKE